MRPPEQFREYLLADVFGYTPNEIDDQPAARLDWLIACHRTVVAVRSEQQKRQQKEANRG